MNTSQPISKKIDEIKKTRVVFILENDHKIKENLENTILSIDKEIKVISSVDLEGFYLWLKKNFFEEKTVTLNLVLIVSQIEFLGPRYFSLLERARKMFVRRGVSEKDAKTEVVLTAFDSPNINRREIETRVINNVIFKPFDQSILAQHLRFALAGNKPVHETTVYRQELGSDVEIEMLKDIQLRSYNELGFESVSDREIKVGAISKYYGEVFHVGTLASVFARCTECRKSGNQYVANFNYFGLTNGQAELIRKSIAKDKKIASTINFTMTTKNVLKPYEFLLINSADDEGIEIKQVIEQRFGTARVHRINVPREQTNETEFQKFFEEKINTIPRVIFDAVFLSSNVAEAKQAVIQKWIKRIESINSAQPGGSSCNFIFFYLTNTALIDSVKRELGLDIADIINLPLDRLYLLKRLKFLFQYLKEKDDVITFQELPSSDFIQVANPIKIREISEAGLIMRYGRELGLGSYRRFSLPRQNESEKIELLGTCQSYVSNKPPVIDHQFVFFGITDKNLKQIRRWILDNYIQTKKTA